MFNKAYDLPVVPVSSKLLVYDKESNEFLVEASTLAGNGVHVQRLFNDACDVGIAVKSEKTGRVVRFVWKNNHIAPDGELQAEVFVPFERDVTNSVVRKMRLIVLND